MPEYKHNSDSVKSVRTEIHKSGLNAGKGNMFAHQKKFYFSFGLKFCEVREVLKSNSTETTSSREENCLHYYFNAYFTVLCNYGKNLNVRECCKPSYLWTFMDD